MAKEAKTNAMRMLDSAHVNYVLHTYDTSDGQIDGLAVARKCGEDPEQVFKTLVTQGNDKNFYVFVVPVENELDLKACARSVGVKSVEMIHVRDLLKTTGYIRGGCSPIGMKKRYTTAIHISASDFENIIVSGGKVGLQMDLPVSALCELTGAKLVDLIEE